MEIDPAFDTTFSRPRGNGAARRHDPAPGYDADSGYHTVAGPSGMLAADADRERAIDVLRAAFAEGRLAKAEYDDRTARAYAARADGQLGALIADLPVGPLGGPAHHPTAGYPPHTARPAVDSMAIAALACGIGGFFTMGLTAIPAIVLGHMARRQARQTGQRGDGIALGALTLGWIGLIAAIIAAVIIAASVSRHGIHPVVAHPVPGGPIQGG
ncbi:MAG TPA: DUF1707 and DUF4190 domain-containing protein [Trebonia sp.]